MFANKTGVLGNEEKNHYICRSDASGRFCQRGRRGRGRDAVDRAWMCRLRGQAKDRGYPERNSRRQTLSIRGRECRVHYL